MKRRIEVLVNYFHCVNEILFFKLILIYVFHNYYVQWKPFMLSTIIPKVLMLQIFSLNNIVNVSSFNMNKFVPCSECVFLFFLISSYILQLTVLKNNKCTKLRLPSSFDQMLQYKFHANGVTTEKPRRMFFATKSKHDGKFLECEKTLECCLLSPKVFWVFSRGIIIVIGMFHHAWPVEHSGRSLSL